MEQNENKTLYFTEIPEAESILKTADEEQYVSAMQLSTAPLVIDIFPQVTIPKGFRWDETRSITWRLSVDQHMLRVVSTLLRQQTTTQRSLYLARLLGTLSYNQVVTGFVPIKGGTAFICGSAGPNNQFAVSTATGSNVLFNTSGDENINEVLGYAFLISDIQYNICNNFSIDVVLENPSVVLSDGTVVTYNPANPTAFFSLFDGQQDYLFVQRASIVVTSGIGSNS